MSIGTCDVAGDKGRLAFWKRSEWIPLRRASQICSCSSVLEVTMIC